MRLIIFLKNTLPFTLIPYCTFIRYSRLLTFLKVLTFKLASRKFRPTFSMPQLLDSSDWNLICKSLTDSYFSRVHYTEYLCNLVFRQNVDPVSLLDLGELKQVFARANHFMPKQRPGEYEFQYKKRLAQVNALLFPRTKHLSYDIFMITIVY